MPLLKDHERAFFRRCASAIRRYGSAGALTAVGTVALAVLGALQALIIRAQLKATELEQRPWLTVDFAPDAPGLDDPIQLSKDVNGLRVTLRLRLANVGHLPAEEASLNAIVYATSPHIPSESAAMQKEACNDPNVFGDTIFPNQTIGDYINRSFYLSWKQIRDYWRKYIYIEPDINPYVVVCASYLDPSGGSHHTPIAFAISAYDPQAKMFLGLRMDQMPPTDKMIVPDRIMGYAMSPD